MKILLIQAPNDEAVTTSIYPRAHSKQARSVMPPLGLLSLASHLKRRHDVYVVDMMLSGETHDDLPGLLNALQPDIVGATAVMLLWPSILKLFRAVKEWDCSVHTVVGGPNATFYPAETLQHEDIDFLIVGNGEKPLMSLCDCLAAGGNGDGIENCYVQGKSYEQFSCNYSKEYLMDNFPFPDRSFVPYGEYTVPFCPENPSTTMVTSQGCPFKCHFCTTARPPVQFRSIDAIMHELEDIQALGIRSVLFQDELFTTQKKRVTAICREMQRRGIGLHWTIKSRIDTIDREMLDLMKNAGCFNIHFGIESGNEKTLKRMNKGYTCAQVKQAVDMVKRAGLSCTGNFMLAYPGETEKEILETIEFAKGLSLVISQFFLTIDSPGSHLFEEALKLGRRTHDHLREFVENPFGFTKPIELFSASDRFSQDQLKSFLAKAYSETKTLYDMCKS